MVADDHKNKWPLSVEWTGNLSGQIFDDFESKGDYIFDVGVSEERVGVIKGKQSDIDFIFKLWIRIIDYWMEDVGNINFAQLNQSTNQILFTNF